MSTNLVIVESPAKAKTINKYLGRNYKVEATVGHIRNLPKTKLGVDIENNFKPNYLNIRGKGDLIKKIKSLVSKSKDIYIATDPDREGEAIAQDIADVIKLKEGSKLYRVLFNEITKTSIKKAMNSPREINQSLVQSQRARRVMDRIIGYKISPFLWKAVIEISGNAIVSAGRVQSVALKIICDREKIIDDFIKTEYWSIWTIFKTDNGEEFKAKLFSIGNKDIKVQPKPVMKDKDWNEFLNKYISISNKETAEKIFNSISNKTEFIISAITKRNTKRNPLPPFITSSLQAEASRRLGMRPRQTMMLAQRLYEGIGLGEFGTQGLITYMRTDSTRLSDEILSSASEYIKNMYGNDYAPATPNRFEKKKGQNVQDAHEAIRPTSLEFPPGKVAQFLDKKTLKIYELIWNRFVASQMTPTLLETTVIEISVDDYIFKAFGSATKFLGFQKVYQEILEAKPGAEEKEEYRNEKIPLGLKKDQSLNLEDLQKTQHFTKPPARFSESSLIKELERNGIGRPSTYSHIVSTIQDRKYVNQEQRKLFPTILGKEVSRILVQNFPKIINEDFTSQMETELDQIASGVLKYEKVLSDFYDPFAKTLLEVEDKIEKIICDKCGGEMEIKFGRFGRYLGCSKYPECDNIKSFKQIADSKKDPEYTGNTCEKCGGKLLFREGKFGRFIGCEKFPSCDFIKNITLRVSCPTCKDGDVVERKSKRGRLFYGCSRFPDCDFVSWHKPVPSQCPNQDSDYMEKRYSKKKNNYLKCPICGEELIIEEEEEKTEEVL
ncbi:MAG: type I DNA topoisomerase [Bacteroidetes bacterium]|nr:type I DNA topoisomerase [Bacteroidota bacterium]